MKVSNEKNKIPQTGNKYDTLVELAPDVVYTISATGKLTSLSSAFESITGWNRKEWLGKNFAKLVHPFDLPKALYNFKKTLQGAPRAHYRLRIRTKMGNFIVGEFRSAPDKVNGKIIGVIGIGRDVTREKHEQEDLAYYKNLFDSADSAIMSRDMKGVIVSWNKAAEKLFGYKRSEIIGKNFLILVPGQDKKELTRINRMIRAGLLIEDYGAIRVRKDGKKIDITAKISPIKDEEGKIIGVSLFYRDNTAKKREEESKEYIAQTSTILSSSLDYRSSLRKLANLLVPELADWSSVNIVNDNKEIEQLAVAHIDPKRVKWAEELQEKYKNKANDDPNNATARVVRTGKSELYPLISDDLIKKTVKNKEDFKLIKKLQLRSLIIVPLLAGKKVMGAITLVSTKKDKLYDENDLKCAEEIGKLAGQAIENARLYYAAQSEIAGRKRVEAELRNSEEKLSVILANVADGITVFDKDRKIVFVNEAIAKASGYKSIKDMMQNPVRWKDTIEVSDENGAFLEIKDLPGRQAVLEGREVAKIIRSYNKISREEKWAVVRARPIYTQDGEVNGSVSITHDITDLKELERKKDDFISIASHELKTPVTSIKGFVHLLKKAHVEYQDSRSYLYISRIENQLGRLTELVEDLLDISRLESGKLSYRLERFNISDLVLEVISDLSSISDKHKIKFSNGMKKSVYADRERIGQVLINFLTNAMKYSPNREKIEVFLNEKNGNIVVGVRDYGIGIEKDETDKIFDRFYRVKDARDKTYPGLGIGLFISREIIKRHNGEIWVKSKKGHGSTFYFSLPRVLKIKERSIPQIVH